MKRLAVDEDIATIKHPRELQAVGLPFKHLKSKISLFAARKILIEW